MATITIRGPVYTACTVCNLKKDGGQRVRGVVWADCILLGTYTDVVQEPYSRSSFAYIFATLVCPLGHTFEEELDLEVEYERDEDINAE